MDVAAGVVAFVTVAVQSANLIYEAAAAYGGGPQDIKQLLDAIKSLCAVLQQLSNLLIPHDLVLPVDLVTDLKASLKDSERQMNTYRNTLRGCLPAPNDTALRKALMRLLPLLYQQDFEKMRQGVLLHLSILTFHTEIVNGIRTAAISKQVATLDRHSQNAFALQRQHADSVAMFQSNTEGVIKASKMTLQAIEQSLHDIPGLLNRHFEHLGKQSYSPKFHGLEDSLLHLHQKFDQLPQSLIEVLPPAVAGSFLTPSLAPTRISPVTVEASLASLHALVKQLYILQLRGLKALSMEQSERFLEALRALLSSTKDAALSGLNVEALLAIIDVARRVRLNKPNDGISFADVSRLAESVVTGRIDSPLGLLTFWSRVSRGIKDLERPNGTEHADTTHLDTVIWVTIGSPPDAYKVCVSFARHSSGEGITFPHPYIRASKVLPNSSLALEAVRRGDLNSLRKAVTSNRVRPTDCDANGRGLVNIACFHGHAHIARFLLSLGADVHALERRVDDLWDCEACHLSSSSLWDYQGFLCSPWRPDIQVGSVNDLLRIAHKLFAKSSIPPSLPQDEPRHVASLRKRLQAGEMDVRVVPSHLDIKPINILVVGQPGDYPQIGNFGPNLHVPLEFVAKASQGASLWQLPFDVEHGSRSNSMDAT